MQNRRFILLAAVLVTLNLGLWVVPQGLALQRVVVASLFGKDMIRADVTKNTGAEWRVARGVVVSNNTAQGVLTIQESDSKVEAINVSSSTKVTGKGGPLGINRVKPGWHVLVTWPAPTGTADLIAVEAKK